ncbi:MAG: NosD domain-containing protein, partial [Lentisphaerota bacterium]
MSTLMRAKRLIGLVMISLLCASSASAWLWGRAARGVVSNVVNEAASDVASNVGCDVVSNVISEVVLGPTSSAADIQAALNNLPESGGTVVLKAGIYSVNQPICLSRDNLTLRGAGATTILRLANHANCPVVIMGSTSNYPTEVVKNLRVCDLDVDGNRDNQQVECWNILGEGDEIRNNGLTIRSVSDASVERVRSYRCRSGGLVTEKGVRRLTVSDYAAWDNHFDGLAAYVTEDSLFTQMVLRDNHGAGLSLDHKFNHNALSDVILADNGCGIFMRDSRENLFQGVTIRNSREHGVFMSQAATNTVGPWTAPTPPKSTDAVDAAGKITNAPNPADVAMAPSTPPPEGRWIVIPDTECRGNVFAGLLITDSAAAGFLINDDNCANNV